MTDVQTVDDQGNPAEPLGGAFVRPGQTFMLTLAHPNLLLMKDATSSTFYCNDKTDTQYTDVQNLCGL